MAFSGEFGVGHPRAKPDFRSAMKIDAQQRDAADHFAAADRERWASTLSANHGPIRLPAQETQC